MSVIDKAFALADTIVQEAGESVNLENKIIMSMVIRLKAEIAMKSIATNKNIQLLEATSNQTREWYSILKPVLTHDELLIFSQVLMMTSENIHINAFMYEPIIDISDWHLKDLYTKLKNLNQQYTN